jgi:hypothetical protein
VLHYDVRSKIGIALFLVFWIKLGLCLSQVGLQVWWKWIASSSNNMGLNLVRRKPLLNHISVFIVHFEIAPVAWTVGAIGFWMDDQTPQAKKSASPTLNIFAWLRNFPCTLPKYWLRLFDNISVFYYACSSSAAFWTFPKVFSVWPSTLLILYRFGLEGFVCKL